jgi:hypothetical protein
VPAVLEATRNLTAQVLKPDTPPRLRLWVLSIVVTAAAVLVTVSLLMPSVQDQVRVIGGEAAPQAATASDLYFALSDLDAQVARLVLIDDADALSGSQIDALSAYRERGPQIDADLERALTTATGAEERGIVLRLLTDLAAYREWAWQALTVESQLPPQPPGKLPPAALGYYTQATNVLHLQLLPAAKQLRDASRARLDDAYSQQFRTEVVGIGLVVLLGGALVVLLVRLQIWLTRRFRRLVNPALVAATVVTLALMFSACVVFVLAGDRLRAARDDSLVPFLALSQAQAISYDAAADTSRYLISANLAYYDQDFAAKSDCLIKGGACGTAGPEAVDRWRAYARDHQKIVGLADSGQTAAAIDALTGIRRGDAAFDFSYFDAAISAAAGERKQAFDASLRQSERLLTGWREIPIAAMGLVLLLVPLSVRKRLAEYR